MFVNPTWATKKGGRRRNSGPAGEGLKGLTGNNWKKTEKLKVGVSPKRRLLDDTTAQSQSQKAKCSKGQKNHLGLNTGYENERKVQRQL